MLSISITLKVKSILLSPMCSQKLKKVIISCRMHLDIGLASSQGSIRLKATLNKVTTFSRGDFFIQCFGQAKLTTDQSSFSGCGFIFRFYYFSKPNSQIAVKVWIKQGFLYKYWKKVFKNRTKSPHFMTYNIHLLAREELANVE